MSLKLKWVDETSYSRGDVERIPQTWAASCGSMRVVVTRHLHYEPTDWRIDFGATSFLAKGNISADEAKAKAEGHLVTYAKRILIDLGVLG